MEDRNKGRRRSKKRHIDIEQGNLHTQFHLHRQVPYNRAPCIEVQHTAFLCKAGDNRGNVSELVGLATTQTDLSSPHLIKPI